MAIFFAFISLYITIKLSFFQGILYVRIVNCSKPDTFDHASTDSYDEGGGDHMFRGKNNLRVVELSATEKHLLVQAMIHFRNKLMALNKPTEDVNEILLRLL